MQVYKMSTFDKKGKKLPYSLEIEVDNISSSIKKHYLRYSKMFLSSQIESIEFITSKNTKTWHN